MKKIILALIVTLTLLSAGNSENNESNKSCADVSVKGCFDSNFMSKLLTKVCNDGKIQACYNLGLMYAKGEGITKNKPKAIELFKKACEGGVEEACENYKLLTTCEE
jgi:hypothetical protein